MKRNRILKSSFVTAAAAMLTIVVLANSTAGIAHAMEQIPVLGAITRVVSFRSFEDDMNGAHAKIDVPQLEGGSQELNQSIQDYTDAIIAQYKAAAQSVEDYETSDAPDAQTNHYAVDLSYRVVTDNDKLFALRFDEAVLMASGTQTAMVYNMDKESGKILTLGQLFSDAEEGLALVSELIKTQMQEQMDADADVYYWLNDEVAAWNFQSVSEETNFYVNEEGALVILFDEGTVAPMYMGLCEFVLPASALTPLALPGYLG